MTFMRQPYCVSEIVFVHYEFMPEIPNLSNHLLIALIIHQLGWVMNCHLLMNINL